MAALDLTNRKSSEELAKLPKPTNNGLKQLFHSVEQVAFKDGGVYDDKALTNEVVLIISQPAQIRELGTLLEIVELKTGFYCLCLGSYAIELISNNQIKATIGLHHGVSIRYNKWNSDAALAKSDELLAFLAELGLTQPLQDRIEAKRNMEANRISQSNWLANAPKCFSKYWSDMNGFEEDYFSSLIEDLAIEIPKKEMRIICLLQTFGRTENFWTAYPMYEDVPRKILSTFDIQEIIAAYLDSDRNYKTRRGLGRFLCSYDFKKQRKKYLKYIPQTVIDDLQKCFTHINDRGGIDEISKLNRDKSKTKG